MSSKGNLSKSVVTELVKSATPEQITALFVSPKTKQVCGLVSRARVVEVLGLTGDEKNAVEEYTYPIKRKPRVAIVKRTTATKEDFAKLSNDNLINTIKDLNRQLDALKAELANRLK